MSLTACAQIVERADPDRFLSTMAAPAAARAVLFPIYALNVEISRAPWVTQETMIAEMRLQWWRDALEELGRGKPPRAHEVVAPLADALGPDGDWAALDRFVAARRWDIYRDPFEDAAHFEAYLDDTAGTLTWTAARALGADAGAEGAVRAVGWASGLANYLRAVPELEARGRIPLVDGRTEAIAELAKDGLDRFTSARARMGRVPVRVASALRAGWLTEPVLRQAVADPQSVAEDRLQVSEFKRRALLLWLSATGRW